MGLGEMILLGLALGTDSFSVSLGIGMKQLGWLRVFRLSLLFSLTQVVLLVIGYHFSLLVDAFILVLAYFQPSRVFEGLDTDRLEEQLHTVFALVGSSLLGGLGVNMFVSYWTDNSGETPVCYAGRLGFLLLAVSVSIDALMAGIGLGMLHENNLPVLGVVVGGVIWLMALVGLTAGDMVGKVTGRRAGLVGGALLIFLAVHFVWAHL